MSRAANPALVGGFMLGTALLAIGVAGFVSGGHWFRSSEKFVLLYGTSIKGLNVGAPVTVRGVKIGSVDDIQAHMYNNSVEVLNTVVIEIDPSALELEGGLKGEALVDDLVKRGLRAQLRVESLLTGLLYVDVDFHPDEPANYADVKTPYRQLPTIPTDLQQVMRAIEALNFKNLGLEFTQIVSGLNKLVNNKDLQNMGTDLAATLLAVRDLAEQLDKQTAALGTQAGPLLANTTETVQELNRTLPLLTGTLQATLVAIEKASLALEKTGTNSAFLTSEDSPILYRLENAATSLSETAQEVKILTEQLQQQFFDAGKKGRK